jgi:hypothetical protein
MVAFLGEPVSARDVLIRWAEHEVLPVPEADALNALEAYFTQLQSFKVGAILEITYGPGGFLITQVAPTPHLDQRPLP